MRPVDTISEPEADSSDYLLLCNDSVFAPYSADSLPRMRESMFSTNPLHVQYQNSELRGNTGGLDWMFFVIIGLLVLVSVYLNRIRFSMKDIFMSLFDQRVQERVEREGNVKIRNLIPMTGIYLASLAAVITSLATQHLDIRLTVSVPVFYLLLLGSLVLSMLVRGGLIRLIGSIFKDENSVELYLTSTHLFYFVECLLLTPLLLLVFFGGAISRVALIISIAIIGITLVTRVIRGIQLILTNSRTSKLYLFYYLCILEIVPILVVAKILIG